MRPEVLLLRAMSEVLEQALDAAYTVHRLHEAASPERLLAEVGLRVKAVVVTGGAGFPDALWDALPALEIIAVYGVGADKLNLDEARARSVAVSFTYDVLTDDVADLAIGLWLSAVRRIGEGDRFVRAGAWPRSPPLPLTGSASGASVGILGLGRIGMAIARRAEPFAGAIRYHSRSPVAGSPYAYMANAQALAQASDVLFVAVTGAAQTRGLVDAAVLEGLGPHGTLVNVSRGAVVDEAALVAALVEGRLGAAGLDVFADEPNVPAALWALDNVVLQPHRGSATVTARARMAESVLQSLNAHFGREAR